MVLLVTAPQYQHARNQSAAVPSSAASGSRNFPGRTSTIATVSGVRRKTGIDVQIIVTTVQHHEDCQALRLDASSPTWSTPLNCCCSQPPRLRGRTFLISAFLCETSPRRPLDQYDASSARQPTPCFLEHDNVSETVNLVLHAAQLAWT